jgi:hypothetical protein
MPWVTSMLVLQPRTSTETDGSLGMLLCVAGISEGIEVIVKVAVGKEKLVALTVEVAS